MNMVQLGVVGVALVLAGDAGAGERKERGARPAAPRPWEEGSTLTQRKRAHARFTEGNARFFERDYARALERYEAALQIFDHPRIRLAAAEVLVLLGRPADAYVHLELALRWDGAPFDADEYARAREQLAAVAAQIGALTVRCDTAGARVTLDGAELLACPGELRRIVTPGRHQIVGERAGYLTHSEEVVAEAGGETAVAVTLTALASVAGRERRWATWKPWSVVAGGAAVALIGVPLRLRAQANMDAYRGGVAEVCGDAGCAPGTEPYDQLDGLRAVEARARLQDRAAISLWAVGGAVALSGLAMVYLNRERAIVVEPAVAEGMAGVGVRGAW